MSPAPAGRFVRACWLGVLVMLAGVILDQVQESGAVPAAEFPPAVPAYQAIPVLLALGALLLASSLVADLLLIAARIVWVVAEEDAVVGPGPEAMVTVVSLAIGALVANIVSAAILIGDTLMSRR